MFYHRVKKLAISISKVINQLLIVIFSWQSVMLVCCFQTITTKKVPRSILKFVIVNIILLLSTKMDRLYILVLIHPVFIVDCYAILYLKCCFTLKDGVERQYPKLLEVCFYAYYVSPVIF